MIQYSNQENIHSKIPKSACDSDHGLSSTLTLRFSETDVIVGEVKISAKSDAVESTSMN